jgi:DNA-binding GntR family transcriptional regulator
MMMPSASVESRSSRSKVPLANKAYFLVREQILRGRFPPGTVLSRRKLAKDLGMSFLPLSEALQRLEGEGLVESRPRVGTRVRTPSPDEVRGRTVVRQALESESARLCCEQATFQERLELRRMAEDLDTLYSRAAELEQRDTEFLYAVHQQHKALHMLIAEYARCPELKRAIENNQVLIYNGFYNVSVRQPALPENFHRSLMEALTGDDPDVAVEAARQHVQYGLNDIVEAVLKYSTGDDWRLKR